MAHTLRDVPRLAATADGRWEIGRGVAYRLWPLLRPMAATWRQRALRRTGVAAVVGSLGKTTTVRCIAAALGEPEPRLPFNQFGLLALNLLTIKPSRARAVLEVGINKPGEMAVYAQLCRPDVVVVTSIASDHFKHMGSFETTAREKSAMLAGLRPGGTAVLNGDDPRVLAMKALTPRAITFGFGEHHIRCLRAELHWPRGTRLGLDVDGQRVNLESRLVGNVMVYPMLAALAVAKAMGIDVREAVNRLEGVTPAPGRLDPLVLPAGAVLLRDEHKASVESFARAFELLAEIPAPRRLAVLGDIFQPWGDADIRYRELALQLAACCDGAYLVGDQAHRWLPGLLAGGMSRDKIACNLRTLDDATARLRQELRTGDVVLIKGRQAEHLERVALALAGRPVACTLRTCESVNLSCERCGGRGRLEAQQDEITTGLLNTVEHSLWRRYNDEVVGDFLSPRLDKSSSLLLKTDVFEEALGIRHSPQVSWGAMVGMDISPTVLGQARQRAPRLPLVRADVRRLPFSDGALAGVVSTSTLDHFHEAGDLENSLAEIARVLRPGGQLLLTLDNPRNPLVALRNLVPHRLRLLTRMTPYYVGYTQDPDELVRVLDGMGFEVRETSAVLHFPRALVGLWGALCRKAGLPLDEPLLRSLRQVEGLATWRTRWLTGQYIVVHARRRSVAG
jgi:UDP-N-acetylmuramoyl-tripeptide--D-alanyl-D-alanine ligase